MTLLGITLMALPVVLFGYAYVGYPAIMWVVARVRDQELPKGNPAEWPELTIVLPVHNEERAIGGTLDSLLALDYPPERRHILVVSDASTDRTDAIVEGYPGRGVRLLRLSRRTGKTGAENLAGRHINGTIVVNTDATTRILPSSLKALVRVFKDPAIGLSSGRDISVESMAGGLRPEGPIGGESGYVGYEMWLRSLETRAGSIVGASGCLYAIRSELFDPAFPEALSRDFASALLAVEHGYRAVSVAEAACLVPRADSLRTEYRRKVRTMARGLETLWFKRRLMMMRGNLRFSFALVSHKLIRWLAFLVAPLGLVGLGLLALEHGWARWLLLVAGVSGLGGVSAFLWPRGRAIPRGVSFLGFAVSSTVAGFVAWTKALRGEVNPTWEPTRRA
ncbi:MAG: glycosyltransferase [Gemmatimonadales bacterium]